MRGRPTLRAEVRRGLDQPRSDTGWTFVRGDSRAAEIQSEIERQAVEQRLAQRQSVLSTRKSHVERCGPYPGNYFLPNAALLYRSIHSSRLDRT